MSHLRLRTPSPAMAVACVALAVALGGTGYAAIKLPRNSVGSTQLKANAVTSAKVKDRSLAAKDFGGSLPRGPRGVEGPRGATGPAGADGAPLTRAAFASRESGAVPVPLTPVGTAVDVLDLAVPAGSSGYVASSGNIVVSGLSRLVAVANATVHSDPAGASLICSFVLDGNRSMGPASNGQLSAASHVSVSITGGADVDPGTHNVRLRCSGEAPGFTFHRGSLTVVATPR